MALNISVKPVSSSSELKTFMKLPWKFYVGDPNWVPPLFFDVGNKLNKKHNAFFDHGQAEYFIAWQGTEPVGRITAQIDDNYAKHWGPGTGQFGFFESADDPAVARALFETARDWLKNKGMERMQGPYNFNINDECGLLVDGYDTPPMIMMTHNPRHYPRMFEDFGFKKVQDLFAYRLDAAADAPDDVRNYAEMIRKKEGVMIREWNLKDFDHEMKRFIEVYNSAWEKNWGSVMLTERELMAHSMELRYLLDPRLAFFAETRDGEVMGMALTLPNLNEYIIQLNGHLYNLLPFMWYPMAVKKKYNSCRVFVLGVKSKFRRSGVGAVFYYDTLMAAKRLGYTWGEMSWILESNDAMNRAIQHMGGVVYKTYRIYEKAI